MYIDNSDQLFETLKKPVSIFEKLCLFDLILYVPSTIFQL